MTPGRQRRHRHDCRLVSMAREPIHVIPRQCMDFHRVHPDQDGINMAGEFNGQDEMRLAICRSGIGSLSGRVWSETNEPQGATFIFASPAGVEAAL